MTSYTRKLYKLDPGAARQLRRRELAAYRHGNIVTLAVRTMGDRQDAEIAAAYYDGLIDRTFSRLGMKRER